MSSLLSLVSIFANLFGAVVLWRRLRTDAKVNDTLLWLCWSIALICHGLLLTYQIFKSEGLNLSIPLALSVALWLVSTILLIGALKKPLKNLGLVILPLCALAISISWMFPQLTRVPVPANAGLGLHIFSSLLAYSILMVAAALALTLNFQHQRLHSQRPLGAFKHFPTIQDTETLLFQFIGLGILLLSISLVTGYLHVEHIFGRGQLHKTILSVLAWLVFIALLAGRLTLGWRGPTAIRWTLWGFALLALAYFGSKLVREIILTPSV